MILGVARFDQLFEADSVNTDDRREGRLADRENESDQRSRRRDDWPLGELDPDGLDDHPLVPTSDDEPAPRRRPESDREIPSRHLSMALLSHMSVLFGVPVFLVPLYRRQHPLSVHHAKTAGLIWFAFYASLALSTVSIPVFIPLAMLMYAPALVAIYRAVQGRPAGRWGGGDAAEWLFPFPDLSNDVDD